MNEKLLLTLYGVSMVLLEKEDLMQSGTVAHL